MRFFRCLIVSFCTRSRGGAPPLSLPDYCQKVNWNINKCAIKWCEYVFLWVLVDPEGGAPPLILPEKQMLWKRFKKQTKYTTQTKMNDIIQSYIRCQHGKCNKLLDDLSSKWLKLSSIFFVADDVETFMHYPPIGNEWK